MTFLIKCDILRNGSYPTPIRQKDFNHLTEVAMLPEQRLAYITNSVRQQKYCSIQQLAKDAGVSAATIRRDLQYLSSQEQVRLTRGGAMHVLTNAAQEPAYAVKSTLNYEEKTRIGLAACKLVHPGETILLDTGTTVYQMTPGLKEMDNITVVTNDVRIAAELATSPGHTRGTGPARTLHYDRFLDATVTGESACGSDVSLLRRCGSKCRLLYYKCRGNYY